jgi:hypothetical protein
MLGWRRRRAVASFEAKGLIVLPRDKDGGYRTAESEHPLLARRRPRMMRRTPLGDAVVAAYRPELKSARRAGPTLRLRWA